MKWILAVAAFVVGIVLTVITLGRRGGGVRMAKTEIAAANASAKARRDTVAHGKEVAIRRIKKDFADELKRLDLEKAQQAKALREDPGALADFLVRTGARAKARRDRGRRGRTVLRDVTDD